MGLGYCSKVVSTVCASPDLPSCRRHQQAPLGASAAAMAKQAADMPAQGILNRVQQCKFGGHAQHTAAPYAFVCRRDGGLLFNCVTGEGKGRTAASHHSDWRSNSDGHPDFVVNLSSRACGSSELGALAQAQVEAAQEVCAVSGSFSTLNCLC